jgi:hypothetical protein
VCPTPALTSSPPPAGSSHWSRTGAARDPARQELEGRARSVAAAVDPALDLYVEKYWATEEEKVEGKVFVSSHDVWELTPERAFGVIETEEDLARRATKWVW